MPQLTVQDLKFWLDCVQEAYGGDIPILLHLDPGTELALLLPLTTEDVVLDADGAVVRITCDVLKHCELDTQECQLLVLELDPDVLTEYEQLPLDAEAVHQHWHIPRGKPHGQEKPVEAPHNPVEPLSPGGTGQ